MTKEFCDICGRPIETYKNVSEFKLKKSVYRQAEGHEGLYATEGEKP